MRRIIGFCPSWLTQRPKFNLELDFLNSMKPFFPATSIPNTAVTTPEQLLHASILGGRHAALGGHPLSRQYLLFNQWRIVSSLGFLEFDNFGFLRVDSVLGNADPTEKGHISYALGALGANLISRNVLGAREIVHVSSMDRFFPAWADYLDNSTRRPDYLAVDGKNQCFVVEAKGARSLKAETRQDLINKGQTGTVQNVYRYPSGMFNPYAGNGFAPEARVGLATEYPKDKLRIFGVDPEPGIRINVTIEDIQRVYLKVLLEKADALGEVKAGWSAEGERRFVWDVPETFEEYLEKREILDKPIESKEYESSQRLIEQHDRLQLWQQLQVRIAEEGLLGGKWDQFSTRSFEPAEVVKNEYLIRFMQICEEIWGTNDPAVLREVLGFGSYLSDGTQIRIESQI